MTHSLGLAFFVSFILALLSALGLTALAKREGGPAWRLGILDWPDERKIHRRPIPYLGGAAMFLASLVGMAAFAWLAPEQAFLGRTELRAAMLGAMAICMLGTLDDVHGLKALPKLAFEALVAYFMWRQGFRIERLTLPLGGTLSLDPTVLAGQPSSGMGWLLGAQVLSYAITAGWYILLMNSMNLIDGLDGLAAGIGAIAAGVTVLTTLSIYEVEAPPAAALLVGLLTAAVCLGFLWHNWHPASIFMGDAGALLIGFWLATVTLRGSTKAPALLTLLVPLVAAGLPIFESLHSFLRRAVRRQNPFRADRRHLHHRLMDLGLSHRHVAMTLLYITLFLGLMSFLLAKAKDSPGLIAMTFLLLGAGFLVLVENLTHIEKHVETARRGAAGAGSEAPGAGNAAADAEGATAGASAPQDKEE